MLFMFIYGLLLTYTMGSVSISGHEETSALKLYMTELVEVSTNFAFSNINHLHQDKPRSKTL